MDGRTDGQTDRQRDRQDRQAGHLQRLGGLDGHWCEGMHGGESTGWMDGMDG